MNHWLRAALAGAALTALLTVPAFAAEDTACAERLEALMERRLEADKRRLAVKSERLWGLSPLKQLSRGYAFATDEKGKRLQSVRQAPVGSAITVHVTDGRLMACVRENQEERHG